MSYLHTSSPRGPVGGDLVPVLPVAPPSVPAAPPAVLSWDLQPRRLQSIAAVTKVR